MLRLSSIIRLVRLETVGVRLRDCGAASPYAGDPMPEMNAFRTAEIRRAPARDAMLAKRAEAPGFALTFRKTGEEIAQSVSRLTQQLHAENEARQRTIEDLAGQCRSPMSYKEAVEMHRRRFGRSRVEYSEAMGVDPERARPEELLDTELFSMFATESRIEHLVRVAKHVERDAIFELTYDELVGLGF